MGRNLIQMRQYYFCVLHKANMTIVKTSEVGVTLAPRNMWAVIFHAVVGVQKCDCSRGLFFLECGDIVFGFVEMSNEL